ncbi:hypothetical protein BDW60DRAFT_212453 [Aspergillus nidulans var. acristatus]
MAMVLGFMLLSLVTFHVMADELILHSVSFVGTVTFIGAILCGSSGAGRFRAQLPGDRSGEWLDLEQRSSTLGTGFGWLIIGPAHSSKEREEQ